MKLPTNKSNIFYPPTLTNTPVELPRSPGSDTEYSGSLEFCSRRWRCGESWSLLTSFAHFPFSSNSWICPTPQRASEHAHGHVKPILVSHKELLLDYSIRVGVQTTVVWSVLRTDVRKVPAWVLEVGFRPSGQGIPVMYLGLCQDMGT